MLSVLVRHLDTYSCYVSVFRLATHSGSTHVHVSLLLVGSGNHFVTRRLFVMKILRSVGKCDTATEGVQHNEK